MVTKMKCRQVKSGDLPTGTEDPFKSPGDSNYASASSSSQSVSLKRFLFPSNSQSTPVSSETSYDDGYDGDSHGSGFSIPSFQPPNYNEYPSSSVHRASSVLLPFSTNYQGSIPSQSGKAKTVHDLFPWSVALPVNKRLRDEPDLSTLKNETPPETKIGVPHNVLSIEIPIVMRMLEKIWQWQGDLSKVKKCSICYVFDAEGTSTHANGPTFCPLVKAANLCFYCMSQNRLCRNSSNKCSLKFKATQGDVCFICDTPLPLHYSRCNAQWVLEGPGTVKTCQSIFRDIVWPVLWYLRRKPDWMSKIQQNFDLPSTMTDADYKTWLFDTTWHKPIPNMMAVFCYVIKYEIT